MFSEEQVYKIYRQAKARKIGQPYRLPKDWKSFFSRMKEDRRTALIRITNNFNTKWSNVNPHRYFDAGFEVFGNGFHYLKFFDKKVINLYAAKDRALKRETEDIGAALQDSVNFIDELIPDGKVSKLYRYINMFDGARPRAIADYLANRIDKYFLVWMVKEGYIEIRNEQKLPLVYINESYDKYSRNIQTFFQQNPKEEILGKIL